MTDEELRAGNHWPYHHCIHPGCGQAIETPGNIWCDQCASDADTELADMAGEQP